MAVCETLARRIANDGGAALLIDYGKNGPYDGSLTAIRGHAGAAASPLVFCHGHILQHTVPHPPAQSLWAWFCCLNPESGYSTSALHLVSYLLCPLRCAVC